MAKIEGPKFQLPLSEEPGQSRMSQLLDSVPQLIWTTNARGQFLYSNLRCLSYIPADKKKNGWIHSIHPDDAKEVAPKWNASIASGEPFEAEFRLCASDETATWFLGCAVPVRDAHGNITEWFGTATDINERRTADASRHRVQNMVVKLESISASLSIARSMLGVASIVVEQGLNSATEKNSGVVLLVDTKDGEPAVELLFADGFTASEAAKLRELALGSDHPLAECLRRREALFFSGRAEATTLDRRAWVTLPLTANGELTGLLAVRYELQPDLSVADTSFLTVLAEQCSQALERVRLLEAEIAARKRADSASKAKAEFLANMSHEIRTPMNAILGFADLLGAKALSTEEREDFRRRIRLNGDQLMRLIDDLLDVAKAEKGNIQIEKRKFSIRELIQETHQQIEAVARRKGIRCSLVAEASVPELIESDPVRLQQVLTNILGNAIKFTDHGRIETRIAYHLDRLTIEIEDTGIGISTELHQRLFQPFEQGDSSVTRRFGGSGLGLVVSRTFAEALGGTLDLVRSTSGGGSVFRLTIPLEKPMSDPQIEMFQEPDTPIPQNTRPTANRELEGVRVLLVEDSVDNEMLIRAYLKDTGVRLEVAHNGKEALDRARDLSFDVVFMDIQMPVMDGLEATRQLRIRNYDRPIVALSAHARPEEVERSIAAGCHSHLTKPILRNALIAQIKTLATPPKAAARTW
jgi:signal transduction histidine kinase/ActR/RegA family two-component response regulator